jgi:hypothetical protein
LNTLLRSLSGGAAPPEITPEMAQQIPPDAVREAAEQAEAKDPSVIGCPGAESLLRDETSGASNPLDGEPIGRAERQARQ